MPNLDQARVADELTTVMAQLTRRMRATTAQDSLTPSQVSVMGRLGREGPATTAALARGELVRPQSMRATLAALEEQSLVTRAPDPTDGRQIVFSLTELGARSRSSAQKARRGWLTVALETELTPAEQRTLTEAVSLLKRLVHV